MPNGPRSLASPRPRITCAAVLLLAVLYLGEFRVHDVAVVLLRALGGLRLGARRRGLLRLLFLVYLLGELVRGLRERLCLGLDLGLVPALHRGFPPLHRGLALLLFAR